MMNDQYSTFRLMNMSDRVIFLDPLKRSPISNILRSLPIKLKGVKI
ncbi:hypothetical protein [Limnoraphis robusta]|uniref:Uncharacterized protein n=1 Tax=Limnoraphis robusta CCNP1315 TaxID=3110306 RepID=A0ABU5TR63_9CYAN|nr:hypothetical protein [Limnoraphis robusta]MEA5517359.1 hypothetical protein [Limnoraphis robusta CCNP1315]MEA5546052.1 hypothetical protein [Limnoraphis robusta CCNP1324]